MISRWLRARFDSRLTGFLLLVAALKITPAMLSVCGLATMVAAGIALSGHHPTAGGVLILLGGILDGLDGGLARATHADSDSGAFLDSICDHVGDAAIYFGLLAWALKHEYSIDVTFIFLAIFGSLFGSHVRSRAQILGIRLKDVGIATRFERLGILIIGLLIGPLTAALFIVAVVSNISALQRITGALRQILQRQRDADLGGPDGRARALRQLGRPLPR